MAWIFSAAMVEACASCTSSPGPAAASSPASSAATAPCAPSSGTPTPQAFSCDSKTLATYRRSRYGMTCAPLTADRGEALLTAYLEAFRAKTSVLLAAAPASKVSSPGSGASSLAWFATWNPSGSGWKTAQLSLLGDSESFSATWPRSGLMRAGMCFPRPTAAPRIFVSESGSSPGVVFPTPCTVDSGSMFNQSDSAGAALRPILGAMARHNLWPTPTVTGNNNRPGASKKSGTGLATAARTWPTPTASEATRGRSTTTGGRSPGRTTSLTGQVNMWPTPTASLGDPRRGAPSKKTAEKRYRQGKRNLDDAVALWPTPTAQDAEQAGGRACIEKGNRGPSLSYAAQMFPTPAARDYRSPNAKSFEEWGGQQQGEQLPNFVGGLLNPTWVEWLQGWPLGWTAAAGPTESGAWGTARYPEWLQQHGCCWRTT